MVMKWLRRSVVVVAGASLIGGLIFGKDLVSYARSSAKSVRMAVKESVPIEFELRRARDLLEDIIPEMHANIRLIAQEEVEVAALKADIEKSEKSFDEERVRVKRLRSALAQPQAWYCFAGKEYRREHVKEDLSRRFELLKESELVLAGKRRLLATREQSLHAATQLLEKTRAQKRMLEDKIGALASQYRLVKAAAVDSQIQVDNSKLAQTEKLIAQIKKRLDIAERVLAHESRFVQSIPVDSIVEKDLLTQVDEYFDSQEHQPQLASAATSQQ